MKKFLVSPLFLGLWRAVRGEVAVAICLYLAYVANKPELVWLAPVLLGVSKYIRDKWSVDLKVI
jgi:hypothetical protein